MAAPGVRAVVLMGSAARGELVTAVVDGRLEVFGDIELLAVTSRRLDAGVRAELAARVHEEGAAFGYRSPLFHAEVLFREESRLSTLPAIVFTHELRARGAILAGECDLGRVRSVTIDTLDRRNTHEILMKRLWALAELIPAGWVRAGELEPIEAVTLAVGSARNALDVLTVLMPEAGVLESGYRARAALFAAGDDLPFEPALRAALGRDPAAYFMECMKVRDHAAPASDPPAAHEDALNALVAALGWLLRGVYASPEEVLRDLPRRSRTLFHESPITLGELAATAKSIGGGAREVGPRAALRWAGSARKGKLGAACGLLHLSLSAWNSGLQSEAVRLLGTVPAVLDSPWPVPPAAGRDGFAESWLAQRVAIGQEFWRTIRLGETLARSRMQAALGAGW
jgi:hypothetical protein